MQVPVVRTVPQSVTVQTLQTETRTGTRRITRCVQGTERRSVSTGGEVVRRRAASDKGGVKVQSTIVGGCTKQVAIPVTKLVARTLTEQIPVTIYDVIEEQICE